MTLILLLALLFTPQAKAPEKCILSGSAVNSVSGEPLNKTEIAAEPIDGRDSTPASTTTDAKGNFTLVDLEPGHYLLVARRNGYLDTYYGARRAQNEGTAIALEAGQELKNLQIKVAPFGVIAGTVRDPDGEPVANVDLSLYQWQYGSGRRRISGANGSATTDDLGQYRITGLSPGKYFVHARQDSARDLHSVDHSLKSAHPPEALINTFYPGAADPAGASLVEVAAGARVTGVDIVLARSRLFHVTVHIEAPPGLVASATLKYSTPGFDHVGEASQNKDAIDIRGVPPGSYVLTASAADPRKSSPGVMTFEFSKRSYETRVPVQVAGADVEDLRIVVNPGAEVGGHIAVEGEKPVAITGQFVVFDNGEADPNNSVVNSDNAFANRLSPGRYVVDLSGITQGNALYVKSMRADGRDILREGLTISGTGKVPIEIVLSPDGGQIEGAVLDKDDKPAAGSTVVLVPEPALRERHDFFREFTADQYGRFQFTGIAPGDYKLFAWDDLETGSWLDPAFLKAFETRGQPVTVDAKGHQSATLHLLASGAQEKIAR